MIDSNNKNLTYLLSVKIANECGVENINKIHDFMMTRLERKEEELMTTKIYMKLEGYINHYISSSSLSLTKKGKSRFNRNIKKKLVKQQYNSIKNVFNNYLSEVYALEETHKNLESKIGSRNSNPRISRYSKSSKRKELYVMVLPDIDIPQTNSNIKKPKKTDARTKTVDKLDNEKIEIDPRFVSVNVLSNAIQNAISDELETIEYEYARSIANIVLGFFGYSNRLIDNILTPHERDIFYTLEDAGLIRSESEETKLFNDVNWRLNYWTLNLDEIFNSLETKNKKSILETDSPAEIYNQLSNDFWSRRVNK